MKPWLHALAAALGTFAAGFSSYAALTATRPGTAYLLAFVAAVNALAAVVNLSILVTRA